MKAWAVVFGGEAFLDTVRLAGREEVVAGLRLVDDALLPVLSEQQRWIPVRSRPACSTQPEMSVEGSNWAPKQQF